MTVCRDTPRAAARSACASPRWARCSRTRFRTDVKVALPRAACQGSFTSRSGRLRGQARVDRDDRAGEGAGVGTAEPGDGRRDLARLEQPAEQGLGGEGLL